MAKHLALLIFQIFTISCLIKVNLSSNVLCLFTSSPKSQLNVFMSVANTLIDRGHNVTVVTTTPIPAQQESKNPFHHVLLEQPEESIKKLNDNMLELTKDVLSKVKALGTSLMILNLLTSIQKTSVENEHFQRFLEEDNRFDLMLLGYFHNDYLVGVAARYGCPVAVISLGAPYGPINRMIGNPEQTSFVPFPLFGRSQPMRFIERLVNFFWAALEPFMQTYTDWIMEDYYKSLFTADFYPKYSDAIRNISLVLFNHHFSLKPIRPLVPALVEIGGIQFREQPYPLPKDIQDFMDSSVNGTIIYSVGSKARGTLLSQEKLAIIISVLSKLDLNVIWEWENTEAPPKTRNIFFKRSLPHEDIFFHQNIKLFITDGRLSTIYAAQYCGLPIIGIPLHAHEPFTVASATNKGFGVSVDINNLSEGSLKAVITSVLENPFYTQKVKDFSRLFRDRPMSPRQAAAFWLEYVIRHRGAPHMQSPLVHMDFVQAWNIDVIAVVWMTAYGFIKLVRLVGFLVRNCLQ